jgi:5'-nucleotidase/UDP-sugar diphosphatase
MTKRTTHLFLILLTLLYSFLSCAYTPDKVYKLTILHTNDHHGRFWANDKGELGLAARATLIQKLREEIKNDGGHVLLIDAGDVNTGIPQSDLLQAEPDFRGMNLLGYDVMAIGNHEFDNTLEVIKKQQEWAGFPFISANIYHKDSNQRVFPSHFEKRFEDLDITIMGLTTEDTPLKSKRGNRELVTFTKTVDEAKKLVPELRAKTDVLIALTHMGHYPDARHGADAPGDVTLAREVNGIDLIVGGHTQKALHQADIQNGTIIVQAEEWGKFLGRVDLEFLNGKVTLKKYELIPVNYQQPTPTLEQDAQMLALLKPFKDIGDATLLIDVGFSEVDFDGERKSVRNRETNLGNLLTQVYREKLKADIGITNGGGIRASMPAGKLTYVSVLTVLPFGNEVGLATIKGSELKDYLSYLITQFGPENGAETGSFPHMSGVEALINRTDNTVSEIKINGKAVCLSSNYTIAISNFLAGGGDKYPKLSNFQTFGFVDADLLRSYIEEKKTLKAQDYQIKNYIQVRR